MCLQSLPGPRHGPHGQHESWGHCSAAPSTPGSSRAESRAGKGEKINTYCTSLDSCSAHRHCGIALQALRPTDTLHGQGRATAGLGGTAALWAGQGLSPHARAGSTAGARQGRKCGQHRLGWTGAKCTSALGHWPFSPTKLTLPRGKKQGLPKFSTSLFEMNGFQRHRVSPTALASLQQDW